MHEDPGQVKQLAAHMQRAVSTYGHESVELEWRIGHRQGAFRPGVGESAWSRLKAALDASPAFQRSYQDSVEKLGTAASIKCIEHDGGQVWVHKKRLADVDTNSASFRPWSVRGSVSFEEVGSAPSTAVDLRYQRRKERWSYRSQCWSVDLTRVRSNLPNQLDSDQDVYEVEVELVDRGMLFERTMSNLVEWGWCIAKDLCTLMAGQSVER